jgi:uncharacterized protein
MSFSMYDASIPVFTLGLTNLSVILSKGAAYAQEKKIDPSIFITARLAPDMFALARQVQIATDIVKGCAARLAGVDVPKYEDNEASFEELEARIAKTIAFVNSFSNEEINAGADKTITLKVGGTEMSFTARSYLQKFVIPNLYFHSSTCYAILRHNGVDLGKRDYLGEII